MNKIDTVLSYTLGITWLVTCICAMLGVQDYAMKSNTPILFEVLFYVTIPIIIAGRFLMIKFIKFAVHFNNPIKRRK